MTGHYKWLSKEGHIQWIGIDNSTHNTYIVVVRKYLWPNTIMSIQEDHVDSGVLRENEHAELYYIHISIDKLLTSLGYFKYESYDSLKFSNDYQRKLKIIND